METINYKGCIYPKFQSEGFASQFAIPFAKHFCKGLGVDLGCGKKEWSFPGSYPIDLSINGESALEIPFDDNSLDYIFSSHLLEHLASWVDALDYWRTKLKPSGVLFLYLPDASQHYWRPYNNHKHIHCFTSDIIYDYMTDRLYKNIFVSGVDLNNSFIVTAEKGMMTKLKKSEDD